MSNIFSKFFMSFGFNKKNKYLPAGTDGVNTNVVVDSVPNLEVNMSSSAKPLASFDINIEKPKYQGAIPEATIKFYPID